MAIVPLVMVAINMVYAASAYPFEMAIRLYESYQVTGSRACCVDYCRPSVSLRQSLAVVLFGVSLWGVHMGITQDLLATIVVDTASTYLRGAAYGYFNHVSGVAMVLASVLGGLLWDGLGASFTFYASAMFCVIALIGLKGSDCSESVYINCDLAICAEQ